MSDRVSPLGAAALFASTAVAVGVMWDISWHQTIGRDTLWTPAHLVVYAGALAAGLACGIRALRTTFGSDDERRAAAVPFWGFRAPFGAWVCLWGAIAMLASAPLDDWWHNAYGLDVKILSPPHAVLAAGIGAIQFGAMLLVPRSGNWFLYAAGLLVLNGGTLLTELIGRWDMHRASFYQIVGLVFPFLLVSSAGASPRRAPATKAALVYTAVTMAMLWILPLFPGEPLLGPIYVQVRRFVPPQPPLLLVIPAMAIDLLMARRRPGRDWRLAVSLGFVFLALTAAVQWPFASFLMSPAAEGWLFGTEHMGYTIPPAIQAHWSEFRPAGDLRWGFAIAAATAFASARCGLWWGGWMARVQR